MQVYAPEEQVLPFCRIHFHLSRSPSISLLYTMTPDLIPNTYNVCGKLWTGVSVCVCHPLPQNFSSSYFVFLQAFPLMGASI
jgi:hypothetical protein